MSIMPGIAPAYDPLPTGRLARMVPGQLPVLASWGGIRWRGRVPSAGKVAYTTKNIGSLPGDTTARWSTPTRRSRGGYGSNPDRICQDRNSNSLSTGSGFGSDRALARSSWWPIFYQAPGVVA
jgi:hypothetical protein